MINDSTDNQAAEEGNQGSSPPQQEQKKSYKVVVEQIDQYRTQQSIFCHLAVKNKDSYLLLKLMAPPYMIENQGTVFILSSGKFPLYRDSVYYRPLNCYFWNNNRKFYRKDIDTNHAYIFMDLVLFSKMPATTFRCSELNQRMFVAVDDGDILVINPRKRRVDLKVKTLEPAKQFCEFFVFGEKENKILTITEPGYIQLVNLNIQLKKVTSKGLSKIEFPRTDLPEVVSRAAVDPKGEFLLIQVKPRNSFFVTSMMMYRIKGNSLALASTLDVLALGIVKIGALGCHGYENGKLVFVGLSQADRGDIDIFEYDDRAKKITHLPLPRIYSHQERSPLVMQRLDQYFYYSGLNGKVMRMKVEVEE